MTFTFKKIDNTIDLGPFTVRPKFYPLSNNGAVVTGDPVHTGSFNDVYIVKTQDIVSPDVWYVSGSNPNAADNILAGVAVTGSVSATTFEFQDCDANMLTATLDIRPVYRGVTYGGAFIKSTPLTFKSSEFVNGALTVNLIPQPYFINFSSDQPLKEFVIYPSGSSCYAGDVRVDQVNITGTTSSIIYSAGGPSFISASYAKTASYAMNGGSGGASLVSGSTYNITASVAINSLTASVANIATTLSNPNVSINTAGEIRTQFLIIPGFAEIDNGGFATFGGGLNVGGDELFAVDTGGNVTAVSYSGSGAQITGVISSSYATTASYAKNIGPANIIYASRFGCALNSNINTGGGTDDTLRLQRALNMLSASGGGELVIDGVALISSASIDWSSSASQSAALMVGSNTTIRTLSGCGVFLASGSHCNMLSNMHITGSPNSANWEQDVHIIGGVWNGNESQQHKYEHADTNNFVVQGMRFSGINNLFLENVTIRNSRTFGVLVSNCSDIYIHKFKTVWDDITNQVAGRGGNWWSGIQLWGPLTNLYVDEFEHNGDDDAIAFNTDEGIAWPTFYGTTNMWGKKRFPTSTNTSLNNIVVKNVFLNNSSNSLAFYCYYPDTYNGNVNKVKIKDVYGFISFLPIHIGYGGVGPATLNDVIFDNYNVTNDAVPPGITNWEPNGVFQNGNVQIAGSLTSNDLTTPSASIDTNGNITCILLNVNNAASIDSVGNLTCGGAATIGAGTTIGGNTTINGSLTSNDLTTEHATIDTSGNIHGRTILTDAYLLGPGTVSSSYDLVEESYRIYGTGTSFTTLVGNSILVNDITYTFIVAGDDTTLLLSPIEDLSTFNFAGVHYYTPNGYCFSATTSSVVVKCPLSSSSTITASAFKGNGSQLTNVSASNIVGTVPSASFTTTASYVKTAQSSSIATTVLTSFLQSNPFDEPVPYLIGNNVKYDNVMMYNASSTLLTVPNISASIVTANLVGSSSYSLTASYASTASYAQPQWGNITVIHADGSTTVYTPTANTNTARGTSLKSAVTAGADQDTIYLSSNAYDIGFATLDLSGGGTKTLHLKGRSKSSSAIISSKLGYAVSVGINSEVADLTIQNTNTSVVSPCLGSNSGTISGSTIRNVNLIGMTDGMFFDNGCTVLGTVNVYNTDVSTNWDAFVWTPSNGNGTLNVYGSNISVVPTASLLLGTNPSDGFVAEGTNTANLFNCNFNIVGSGSNTAIGVYNLPSFGTPTVNLYGCVFSTSGGSVSYDIRHNVSSTSKVGLTSNNVFDVNKTSGSLTYLDTQQIYKSINNVVTSSISSSYALTASYAMNGGGVAASTNYNPYSTVVTSSTLWVTASFATASIVVNIVNAALYNFTASNMPSSGQCADTLIYINNTSAATSSLSFPATWVNLNGGWPTSMTSSKSAMVWLRGFDTNTIIGTFSQQL